MPDRPDSSESLERASKNRGLSRRSRGLARRLRALRPKVDALRKSGDTEVVFPDKILEQAIREELEKPRGALTRDDLAELRSFAVADRSGSLAGSPLHPEIWKATYGDPNKLREFVAKRQADTSDDAYNVERDFLIDLSGLEHAINLKVLRFYGHAFSDITPIGSLTNLTELELMRCCVRDIQPLMALENLENLILTVNPLSEESIHVYIPRLQERGVHVGSLPVNDNYLVNE
tara:strand:- start:1865 stop:2563 length:699 start_codon:yes stop_codon:yes gene_type:complete